MPESYRRENVHPYLQAKLWTLLKAAEIGQVVVITCKRCKVTRNYACEDLAKLFGDVELRRVEAKFRCGQCQRKEFLEAKMLLPTAEERQTMVIRRLVEIRTRLVPVWQDRKGG